MTRSNANDTTAESSVAGDQSDHGDLLDEVLAEIRGRGLSEVLTACYVSRAEVIRIAGVGETVEDGMLACGVDYSATTTGVEIIRGHLTAFAWRRGSRCRTTP